VPFTITSATDSLTEAIPKLKTQTMNRWFHQNPKGTTVAASDLIIDIRASLVYLVYLVYLISLVCLVCLVSLVYLVYLVYLVCLVSTED